MSIKRYVFIAFGLASVVSRSEAAHPMLLNTRAQWTSLRASSTTHPYSDIIANATTYLSGPQAAFPNAPGQGYGTGSDAIRQQTQNNFMDLMGAYTLLYVINTNNASSTTYRSSMTALMDQWPAMRADQPLTDGYNTHVPMNGAFMAMTLGFDTIHDDLSAVKISSYEVMMDSWVAYVRPLPSSWQLSDDGALSTYSLYRSTDSNQIMLDTQCYHADLLGNDTIYPPAVCGTRQAYHDLSSEISDAQLNVDGISGSGSSYAWERVGGKAHEKLGKWGGKYVLDFTGADTTIKPHLQNFYEWLFTGHTTPWSSKVPFGDTANNQGLGDDFFQGLSSIYGHNVFLLANGAVSAGQYSGSAQKWANRMISISTIPVVYPGDFINYVEASSDTTTGQPIVSKVVAHGGAAFWDDDQSTAALQGVLDNYHITKLDHTHNADWNGLYLAGYGENLLSNLGVGANTDSGTAGFSLYWTKCASQSGNTALFGNRTMANNNDPTTTDNHAARCNSYFNFNPITPYVSVTDNTPLHGADGITESILGTYFDYAVGLATSPYVYVDTTDGHVTSVDGVANRDFMFVHPSDGANGYWIVGDEMTQSSFSTVNVVWHPYGTSFTTTTATTEYQWPISPRLSDNSTKLAVFLATPPSSVAVASSPFNASSVIMGSYINATYNVDTSSNARILTVLYPSNPSHAKATFTRILDVSQSTGARIDTGGSVVDTVLVSSPNADRVSVPFVSRGRLTWQRSINNQYKSYFLRQGTHFLYGVAPSTGIDCDHPISIYMRDDSGKLVATTSTSVTFYKPGITGVTIDGSSASGTAGTNQFTTTVSSGSHTVALTTTGNSSFSSRSSGQLQLKGHVSLR